MPLLDERTNPGHGSGPSRYPGSFLLAFRAALASLKWQAKRWLGDAVECVDATGHEQVVGLENLYRRARQAQRSDWPTLITDFLSHATDAGSDEDLPKDLTAVADQLLPRLGPPFTRKVGDATLWSQPVEGTDFVVNLVVDYPNRMIYVTEQMVKDSDKPGGDWLERALVNLRRNTPDDALHTLDDESGLSTCALADAYDSSRALLLDALLPAGKEDGYFVGLPGRDQLLVLPVTAASLGFVHVLKVLVVKNHKSLPYPISNQVFWVRGGVWRRFPIEIEGNEVTITPPEEFSEVLERLTPPDEDDEDEDEDEDEPESDAEE